MLKTSVLDDLTEFNEAGQVLKISTCGMEISTGKGTLLLITVKPESKGEMAAQAWVNGAKIKVGDKLI